MTNVFNQCGKGSNCGLITKGEFEIHAELTHMITLYKFSEERRSKKYFFLSAVAKGIKRYLGFVSPDEEQVTEIVCLTGI